MTKSNNQHPEVNNPILKFESLVFSSDSLTNNDKIFNFNDSQQGLDNMSMAMEDNGNMTKSTLSALS